MFNRLTLVVAALMVVAAPAFAAKDSITVGMVLEPPGLDPTSGAAAATDEVTYANVFQGLTRFGPEGQVEPDLAKSWDISPDGKVWTFHLHKGVTFQDGTPFDASVVKFSLDRINAAGSTNAQKPLYAQIEKVEVVDPQTVKIILKAPVGDFASNLAWGDAEMVSPKSIKDEATDRKSTRLNSSHT